MEKLTSRKFIISALAVILAQCALMQDHIGAEVYRDIVIGVCLAYITGNVAQKQVTKNA